MEIIPKSRVEKRPGKKKTHDEYVYELSIENPNLEVLGEYKNSATKILHKYINCGHEDMIYPSNALRNVCGCKICRYQNIGDKLRKTNEDYIKELKEVNKYIKPLEDYQNANTPIMHLCTIHNVKWKIQPSNALKGHSCYKCHREKQSIAKRNTTEDYLLILNKKNINVEPLEEYVDGLTPILHRCKQCNYEWVARPDNIRQTKIGCPVCAINHVRNATSYSKEEYQSLINISCPNVIIVGDYINTMTPTKHKCLICDTEWSPYPGNVLKGHGCPVCSNSLGEKKISSYLNKYNIEYVPQKSYDNLVGIANGLLSYDFYLPKYNKLIEFQGIQHEQPIEFFGGEKQFKIQQEHDRRKREYAKNNNINLLEIWYYDIDEIEIILENELELESVETVIPA